MSIFKKLFGKKKNSSKEVSDELKTDPEILDIRDNSSFSMF